MKRSLLVAILALTFGFVAGNLVDSNAATPFSTVKYVTVVSGDTYTKIAQQIAPTASAADQAAFARYLAHANGGTDNTSLNNLLIADRILIYDLARVPATVLSTTTTAAVTTTTLSPTTTSTTSASTTTIIPTTTTVAPSNIAFSEQFDGPLDPARFTSALWRAQEGEPGNVQPSTIAVESGALRIENGQQNYGDAAVRINQPFDFADRTGTFTTDVTLAAKDGWTRLSLSRDPYAVTSYGDDNAAGQGADRGIDLQFQQFASCSVVTLRTYANRVETDHDGGFVNCAPASNALSHVTVTVSNSAVTVKVGTLVIGNFSGLDLGFSRGYWYLDSHNHATIKYANQPTWVTRWDNVTFDGPALPILNVAAAPMALVEGITINTSIPEIPANLTSPVLIFNARHGQQDASPRLSYRLNGNSAHQVNLIRLPDLIGTYMLVVPLDPAELVNGTNSIQWTWTSTTGILPAIGNVQLAWNASSGPSTSTNPTTTSTTAPVSTTTTSVSTPSTTTIAATTTTQPITSAAFSEDFADGSAFTTRFDHGWSGEVNAGRLNNDYAQDWAGDHDMSCGDPSATHRTIHVTPPADEVGAPAGSVKDVEQAFYSCAPGGDVTKAHLMTSVNTEGYVVAWFSPKPVFTNVHRVCWDQNTTNLGGGKWTQVVFLTPTEYQGQTDLGYTSPEFPDNGGPSSPQGDALYGLRVGRNEAIEAWSPSGFNGAMAAQLDSNTKAPRYQHCAIDNENGTLTVSVAQPDGTVKTGVIPGQIPNGPIRVVFEDDNYNPDKHFDQAGRPRDSTGLYTWHWDNIQISS